MKLASFFADGTDHIGIVTDSGVIGLNGRSDRTDLAGLLAEGLDAIRQYEDLDDDFSFTQVRFHPPVRHPTHIIGIGLNITTHHPRSSSSVLARSD